MNNSVGNIIRVIGIVIIGIGVIASIIVWIAVAEELNGFIGFLSAIGTVVGAFISGIMFIGFSEIIYLLQSSINIMNKDIKDVETTHIEQQSDKTIAEEKPEPKVDIKKIIESQNPKTDQVKCPYCGHIQSKNITRCLSCSKMITE